MQTSPRLRRAGFDFHELDVAGGHAVPPESLRRRIDRLFG